MKTRIGVILAAGKGKRLDKQDTIKPLVRVRFKPLILWNIERMQEVGMEKIYIVVGYRGDLLKKELIANPFVKTNLDFIENPNCENGMLSSLLSIKEIVKGSFFLSPCDLIFENNPYYSFQTDDMQFQGITSLVDSTNSKTNGSGATSRIIIKKDGSVSMIESRIEYDGIETGIYHFGKGAISIIAKAAVIHSNMKSLRLVLEYLSNNDLLRVRNIESQKWFDINIPSIRIRAEMFLRKKPVIQYAGELKQKPLNKIEPFEKFFTNKEIETQIYVKRNCLKEIDTIDLIPSIHSDSPHFLITDETVNEMFGRQLFKKLANAGYNIHKIVLSSGEGIKSLQNFISLSERILAEGIDERTILISLGGGTVNNITGFLASTLYRGIYLVHIPTTLMAQCDAAIGIKQGVNGDKGKNLVGSYYEPMKIVVDPAVLTTCTDRWLRDGLVECIKHALAQDPIFFDYLFNYDGEINDINFLEYVVKRNIELKIRLMSTDPKEHAEALVLQYGHTIGHAVEYLSGYLYGHGESVAIGMRAAAELSKVLDIAGDELVQSHCDILRRYDLPGVIPDYISHKDIIDALRFNKRFLYGDVQFVLLDQIGSLWNFGGDFSVPCDDDILTKALLNSYTERN